MMVKAVALPVMKILRILNTPNLEINYYVNLILGGLGSNEFQLKLRFGTRDPRRDD